MTWVSVSLRKMTLKGRINGLEERLMNISQQIQSTQEQSANALRGNSLESQANSAAASSAFKSTLSDLKEQKNSNTIDSSTYQANIFEAYTQWTEDKSSGSIFDAQAEIIRSEAAAKTSALEMEQEMLEAQLKSARSEYDALGEALDKDIEQSTIKLV